MCNAGGSMGRVVGYIGWVGPDEDDDPLDLKCGECDAEVKPDESMLCLCGEVLCTDCVVIGAKVDSCKHCADQLALEAAGEQLTHPHLTLIMGGA